MYTYFDLGDERRESWWQKSNMIANRDIERIKKRERERRGVNSERERESTNNTPYFLIFNFFSILFWLCICAFLEEKI